MDAMKRTTMLLVILVTFVTLAAASSKINDETFRLIRQLISYKNQEINGLESMTQYMLDCQNVSDAELKAKNCSARLTELQTAVNASTVKHDVLGQEIASYIRQHKDEDWIFMGLMLDDKEFSSFAH
jgi:hypothetical protein